MATGQYDNAWETPGWTAQLGYYPDDVSDPDGPPITPPAGLKQITVTGTYLDDRSRPQEGVLTFTPSVRQVRADGKTLSLRTVKARVRNGMISVRLVAPDGTEPVFPATWTWNVRQRVGPSKSTFDIVVPIVGDEIDTFDAQYEDAPDLVSEFPLTRNYTFTPGQTFRKSFTWTQSGSSSDISDWTATLQVRESYGGALLLELTEASGITLGSAGEIDIEITADQTSELESGVYDLELYEPGPDGDTIRFLQGRLTAGTPEVTN